MQTNFTLLFYIFMTSMFSCLIMVPFLRHWALDKGIVDRPGGRKKHSQITPRLGGIAIGMSFIFSLIVFVDLTREMRGVLAGALVIFVTGLADDLVGISPRRKFCGEIGGCLMAIFVGELCLTRLGNPFGLGEIVLPLWLAFPFTVFAVVGVINAINLIDGLDGLSGGVSMIALAAFFVLGFKDGNQQVMLLSAGLMGAVLGFLKYNFYPARIFMGDTGSLVTGFILAVIAIRLTQSPGATVNPAAPLIILGLPIIDTVWVMTRRVMRRQSPFSADRTHIHHKFLNLGLKHRFTVIIIYGLSLFWATFAVLCKDTEGYLLISGYLAISGVIYLVINLIRRYRHVFGFIRHDSVLSLRRTRPYQFLARCMAGTGPLTFLAVSSCFALAAIVSVNRQDVYPAFPALLLVAVVGLILYAKDLSNQYVQAMLYAAGMLVAFVIGKHEGEELVGAITVGGLADAVLAGIALLVLLRIVFTLEGFFLDSIDYLFFGVCIFLVIAAYRMDEPLLIGATIARGVAIALGLKAVATAGRLPVLLVTCTVMAALLVIAFSCLGCL